MLRKIFGLSLMLAGMCTCTFAQNAKATIVVNNPSGIARTEELVAVDWKDITAKYPGIDTANFKVMDLTGKREVAWQLEHRGEKGIKNLLLQLSLKASASLKLAIVQGKPATVGRKTFGRYVPERFDDFAWENDKIAFRMYGKALEGRKDNAFGTDVWAKRNAKLILDEWYKSGDYHKDHGDGLDYYHVGFTLGAGDIAPFVKDSVYYPGNYRTWRILDQGPLRFTFELSYAEWNVAGKSVKVVKTISLDAGSQMNRVEAVYTLTSGNSKLPVVIGIIKRKEAGEMLLDEKGGILGYWEPVHGEDGIIGTGTIALAPVDKMSVNEAQLFTHATVPGNQAFVYYNGAAWNKAGQFTAARAWFDYLVRFKQKLEQPLKVGVQ
ncbi:MAG TPA: DUF4861 family protein [Pedobacter sp.]|uniref:DUF4861 family protein n=1 Tax=Pedobacter sp. TaxID=1411316 RepID=UPI002BB8EB14|nr:DUF4861 family protein [Pedobacter sp.]HMI03752.1 DUF4861 family protein [Pedobacter sp.]